jgi:cohesin complex subunit SA-1/2
MFLVLFLKPKSILQEILENNRREITSALLTRYPHLLRKFISDKAKISPIVDMMTLLKLELYSYKRQEKVSVKTYIFLLFVLSAEFVANNFLNMLFQHFMTAIDLIADAFFKHGEKDPLRSCIKAIMFCCTECQADLKDYAENKLKNLEDELVLKVRTAIKEVEVYTIHAFFPDELKK